MKIRKVWAMYFSPTGTTEKTVTALASEIAEMTGAGTPYIFDFTLPDARKSFPDALFFVDFLLRRNLRKK